MLSRCTNKACSRRKHRDKEKEGRKEGSVKCDTSIVKVHREFIVVASVLKTGDRTPHHKIQSLIKNSTIALTRDTLSGTSVKWWACNHTQIPL